MMAFLVMLTVFVGHCYALERNLWDKIVALLLFSW